MTVGELQERLTPDELYGWSMFYKLKRGQEEAAMKKAQRRR